MTVHVHNQETSPITENSSRNLQTTAEDYFAQRLNSLHQSILEQVKITVNFLEVPTRKFYPMIQDTAAATDFPIFLTDQEYNTI